MMKKTILYTALSGAFMVASQAALAALPVSSAVPAGVISLSDNSAEQFIDKNGNGILDTGDVLRGILSIDNFTGLVPASPQVNIGTGTAYNELTGIFQIVVTSAVADGARWDFTFAADPLSGFGAGVAVQLYDDPAQNFARAGCASFAACEATVTGGSLWATLGLGASGFWTADNALNDPDLGYTLPFSTPMGNFSTGLNFITNNTGFTWNKVNCADLTTLTVHSVDVCGQGGILATGAGAPGGADTPYGVWDNVDFTANRVPEPSSLALVGLALGGLGWLARRRKV